MARAESPRYALTVDFEHLVERVGMRLGSYVIHDERCKRCGRCARVCAAGAISVPEGCYVVTTYGTASIDQSKCTGCGACAKACKLRAISKKFAINL